MSTPAPLNENDREDLVAYLDGEVDQIGEEKARLLETKINLDVTVRAEAETLKRTWDLLDYLPRPEASPTFTNRTIDKLSVRETQQALRPRRSRWLLASGWVAAVLLAALGGYFGATRLFPVRPGERELVRELRLIENLRFYEPVESLEFLQDLDQKDLFGEDPLDS
jgi:hypothetical protein